MDDLSPRFYGCRLDISAPGARGRRSASSLSQDDIALALQSLAVHSEVDVDRRIRVSPQAAPEAWSLFQRRDSGLDPAHGRATMPQPADDDSTIQIKKPTAVGSQTARSRLWPFVVLPVLLVLGAAGAWLLWSSPVPSAQVAVRSIGRPSADAIAQPEPVLIALAPPAAPMAVPPAADSGSVGSAPEPRRDGPALPEFLIETATEQRMLDHVAGSGVTIFRLANNPRILVFDFASLRDQGRMLNRAAAFVEKSGLPHDRVLTDPELEAAVQSGGGSVETFYYGHDYSAGSLARFFNLADRDNLRLAEEEEALRRLIRQEGWFEPSIRAGMISIPRTGADEHVTKSIRASILHHELSHGEFFTSADYAAFVHHFWTQVMTGGERDRMRRYLQTLGYESSLDEVIENEAQAYLMFTYSPEFFTPEMVGMRNARLSELRSAFHRAMPSSWLRDSLGQYLNETKQARP